MNEEVKTVFKYNGFVVNKNLQGISQEDSLKSPEHGGNCINWILGHIVVTRDVLLETLGAEKFCDEKITESYVRGSDPIKSESAENIEILLGIYNDSQKKIMESFDQADLKEDQEKNETVAGLGFHEAYHAGQIGILRRIIGREGLIK